MQISAVNRGWLKKRWHVDGHQRGSRGGKSLVLACTIVWIMWINVIYANEGHLQKFSQDGQDSFSNEVVYTFPVKNPTKKSRDGLASVLELYSLHPPFTELTGNPRYWDFGGNALVQTRQFIRLTMDRPSRTGWLWSKIPFSHTNWICEWEFMVHGSNRLYGDGYVLWFVREPFKPGPVYGMQEYFYGLAVIFDTYANSRHSYAFPYVSIMYNNGTLVYDQAGDNARTQLCGCSADFRNKNYPTRARLSFLKGTLELQLDIAGRNEFTTCCIAPGISFYEKSLSSPGAGQQNESLTKHFYFGFSAMTGAVSDFHDILHVNISSVVWPHENKLSKD